MSGGRIPAQGPTVPVLIKHSNTRPQRGQAHRSAEKRCPASPRPPGRTPVHTQRHSRDAQSAADPLSAGCWLSETALESPCPVSPPEQEGRQRGQLQDGCEGQLDEERLHLSLEDPIQHRQGHQPSDDHLEDRPDQPQR